MPYMPNLRRFHFLSIFHNTNYAPNNIASNLILRIISGVLPLSPRPDRKSLQTSDFFNLSQILLGNRLILPQKTKIHIFQ